jgi:hypothetical protein
MFSRLLHHLGVTSTALQAARLVDSIARAAASKESQLCIRDVLLSRFWERGDAMLARLCPG